MVSGLVTSPCDQLRIFSGDARLMRMASKSATGFAISNGLERNMFLRFPVDLTRPPAALDFSSQFPVLSENQVESLPLAALRAKAAVANHPKTLRAAFQFCSQLVQCIRAPRTSPLPPPPASSPWP